MVHCVHAQHGNRSLTIITDDALNTHFFQQCKLLTKILVQYHSTVTSIPHTLVQMPVGTYNMAKCK